MSYSVFPSFIQQILSSYNVLATVLDITKLQLNFLEVIADI